jgi:glycosyltransferase involved in cell wall biosynthesis
MMHFGIPVLAHDCAFNRYSTEERARYFESAVALAALVRDLCPKDAAEIGAAMKAIALQRYTWDQIGMAYFDILDYAPT